MENLFKKLQKMVRDLQDELKKTNSELLLLTLQLEERVKTRTEDLKKTVEQYRSIFENAAEGIFQANPNGGYKTANPSMARILGYASPEELLSNISDIKHQVFVNPKRYTEIMSLIKKSNISSSFESQVYRKDGSVIWISEKICPVFNERGKLILYEGNVEDVSERKRIEEELRKHRDQLEVLIENRTAELKNLNIELENKINEVRASEERFRSLVLTIPDIIYRVDPDGNFIFLNEAIRRLGYDPQELIGKHFSEIIYSPDVERISREKVLPKYAGKITGDKNSPELFDERRTGSRKTTDLEIRIAVKNKKKLRLGLIEPIGKDLIVVEVNSSGMYEVNPDTKTKIFLGTVGVIRDITERKLAEKVLQDIKEELERKERLAELGKLAGGMSHELRNPLGAIKNATYFLKIASKKQDSGVREALKFLEKEVYTAEKITCSLLDFARLKPPVKQKIDVNCVIRDVLSRNNIPENIRVSCKLGKSRPHILADPIQLSQVFSNLICNAVQAMSEGGRLEVKSGMNNKKQLVISFSDTGEGISKELKEKLFEPLFTTKANGNGLGLAITKTMIEGHGGSIKAQSKVGKGCTFTVMLPTGSLQ